MIIARAPFRVSFAGGGSDVPEFYRQAHGAVTGTAIDKYMYIMIHPYFHDKIRLKYSKTEDVNSIDEIEHPLIRECLRLVGIERGVEIASIADVPAGTGLGSSSSFTVCLLHALYAYTGTYVTKERLAAEACRIEIDTLKQPVGKQDQYLAAYGGLNHIRFNPDETVFVTPVICAQETLRRLGQNLMMFFVGAERSAAELLTRQRETLPSKLEHLKKMVRLAEELRDALSASDLARFGKILHEGWVLKKQLAGGIASPLIDEYYDRALRAGAVGGKLLGAGGTGFLLFYCEPRHQDGVRAALKLRELAFRIEYEGSKIIYFSG